MKNIPIVILNKDRLNPTKSLVASLHKRNYTNIIIIDNRSTYEPLLSWYDESGVTVFHNNIPETRYDNGTFFRLGMELNHPVFRPIVENFYVFTDSDVVPAESVPDDFIDHMITVVNEFNVHKVGLGLKIDDLPDNQNSKNIIGYEHQYWETSILHSKYKLFNAPVDTTFAVYGPNQPPVWGNNTIRMGGDYTAHHVPWYYDMNNLPEDELYYLNNLQPNMGPVYSMRMKEELDIPKKT